jgi:hypothetical protein
MHPAYGVFAAGVVALGLVPALRERPGAGWAQLAACVLAVAAGLAWAHLCSPPGTTPGLRIGLYRPNLWSLLISIGPWWLIAAPSFRAARRGGAVQRLAAAGALAAAFMALFVVLPQLNTEKLFYLAWVSLVPLAAAGYVWWADRLRLPAIARVAVLAALVLPTAGLYAIGTASDRRSPGVLVRGDTPATRQMPLATGPEAAGYKFMRAQLPRDAMVIESARPTVNEPVPVLGERRVFCGSLNVYLSNHFGADQAPGRELLALRDEFYVRRSIQESLFRDAALNQTQSLYLEGFSQPLYLLIRRREVQDPIWEGFRRRAEWSEMLANEEIRLYRYEPRGVAPTLAP